MAYEFQEFPKIKYHPQKGTHRVENAEEEKALGITARTNIRSLGLFGRSLQVPSHGLIDGIGS
jgi:hypothetical protein